MSTVATIQRSKNPALFEYYFCVSLLVSATFFQKIALPGTGGTLPLSLFMLTVGVCIGLLTGRFVICAASFLLFSLFLCCALASFLNSDSTQLSINSLFLLLAVQFPLALRFHAGSAPYEKLVDLTADLGFLFALFSIAQFGLQLLVGKEIAFFIDLNLPSAIAMKELDFLVPLYWSSPLLKSNGFFLAEPSLLSQWLGLGIAAELLTRMRLHRLPFLATGLLCSYSGTGMMMLALFLPLYILRYRRMDLVLAGLCALPLLAVMHDFLHLDAVTRRIDEFSSFESSGFARFLSSFYTLGEFVFNNISTALLGRGPGTVQEFWSQLPYEAFDPTWGKLLYEYGAIGAICYMAFFYESVLKHRRTLTYPLVFTYFLLGGYLLNAFVVAQLLVLLTWTDDRAAPTE